MSDIVSKVEVLHRRFVEEHCKQPEFLILDIVSNYRLQAAMTDMEKLANIIPQSSGVVFGVKYRGARICIARLQYDEEAFQIIKFAGE